MSRLSLELIKIDNLTRYAIRTVESQGFKDFKTRRSISHPHTCSRSNDNVHA